ncbi:CarD family transcriptional regulator [Aestuariivirga sp.]|uniref:CarD family transcriptional regulator n=1 Tax=Aestuariivirga sp. TaxID=2650926 RepID=UPI0025BB8FD1|nr:CarD family transcriptional regulator [Aestuariivirga sp.]MCA3555592.1 CarD family transcriptional regulator [Aestuariivirga sp.]
MTKSKTKAAAPKKPAARAKTTPTPKKTAKQVAAARKPAAPAKAVKPVGKPAVKAAAVKPAAKASAKPAAAAEPAAAAVKPAAKAAAAAKPAPEARKAAKPAAPVAATKSAAPRPAPAQKPVAAAAPAAAAPVVRKLVFKVNELVVYPAHGVGKVSMIEEQEIAGVKLELYIVEFEKEKLRLKVPTSRAEQKGMRRLSDKPQIEAALKVLRGRARIKRTMWSRRAQEYDAKINSGDIMAVAEVVRDLYRSERQPEQSYSERQLFEQALDRMAREIAAVKKIDDDQAVKELEDFLSRNAKRPAGEKSEDEVAANEAA